MKKTLLALAAVIMIASSSFAGQSFLVAPSVGVGNWAVLGMYGTDHIGNIANNDSNPNVMDGTGLGVRGEYGVIENLDVLAAYAAVTLPNIKDADAKQTSGSNIGIGIKYTILKDSAASPVDVAIAVGYEQTALGIKPADYKQATDTLTNLSIAGIVSKKINMYVPYGGVALKSVTNSWDSGTDWSGTALAFNLGVMVGVAANQAVAIEYNTETISWADASYKGHTMKGSENATNVSGISLGYAYMF